MDGPGQYYLAREEANRERWSNLLSSLINAMWQKKKWENKLEQQRLENYLDMVRNRAYINYMESLTKKSKRPSGLQEKINLLIQNLGMTSKQATRQALDLKPPEYALIPKQIPADFQIWLRGQGIETGGLTPREYQRLYNTYEKFAIKKMGPPKESKQPGRDLNMIIKGINKYDQALKEIGDLKIKTNAGIPIIPGFPLAKNQPDYDAMINRLQAGRDELANYYQIVQIGNQLNIKQREAANKIINKMELLKHGKIQPGFWETKQALPEEVINYMKKHPELSQEKVMEIYTIWKQKQK